MRTIVQPELKHVDSAEFVRLQQLAYAQRVAKILQQMHRQIAQTCSRKRAAEAKDYNAKTKVQQVYFDIGDYVLVAQRESVKKYKFQVY